MYRTTELGKLLNTARAAAHCGLAESTLEKRRVSGDGPVFIKVGRKVIYDENDLNDWLASRRRTSTSDDGSRLPLRHMSQAGAKT